MWAGRCLGAGRYGGGGRWVGVEGMMRVVADV